MLLPEELPEYVDAVKRVLRFWPDRQLPRADVLAMLRGAGLTNAEAMAVVDYGVARGLLIMSDGLLSVRAT